MGDASGVLLVLFGRCDAVCVCEWEEPTCDRLMVLIVYDEGLSTILGSGGIIVMAAESICANLFSVLLYVGCCSILWVHAGPNCPNPCCVGICPEESFRFRGLVSEARIQPCAVLKPSAGW
jgi:hypothetical protein